MLDFQKITFDKNTQYDKLNINFKVNEIYIDKSSIGKNDTEKLNYNFLAVGRNNDEAKKLIANLSNHKFFLISHSNGVSLFRKFADAQSFSKSFSSPNLKTWNDTFYTLETPDSLGKSDSMVRLLVIFSSISDFPFNASIDRRMFFKNFPSIGKYIPKNTYILRIADIGGVLGSFYLNSNADMQFEQKIEKLIRKIQLELSISDDYTVLYGSSKGATGALYHGIKLGLKALVVDPIISDEFYLKKHNDLHFVRDVFPESKQQKFNKIFKDKINEDLYNIKLVTSPNSEQFSYISENILIPSLKICSYIFNNPKIEKHTDVGEHTLNFVISMINNMLYNIDIKSNLVTSY